MLFLMYTLGTTGQPKEVKHIIGSYFAYAVWTSHAILDIKKGGTYWYSADIDWITGHSYIVHGSLALGMATVMHEGTSGFSGRDRLRDIIGKYAVDIFCTAPTATRAFIKWGSRFPE